MTQAAGSKLDQLAKQPPGVDRGRALSAYIQDGEAQVHAARLLRDEDFRVAVALHGKAEAARLFDVSLSTVKLAVGRKSS